MDRMLYTAMTGATEMMHAQSVTANNLANVSTTAFKRELALQQHVPVEGESSSRHYSIASTTAQDFEPGQMKMTGRSLDVAVEGKGWMAIVGQNGLTGYTRAGSMQVSDSGILMDRSGNMVLGNNGPVAVPPDSELEIAADGTVNVIGDEGELALVDRIMLVNPENNSLKKDVDGLFRLRQGGEAPPAAEVRVRSGYLEGSNVSAVEAMTEMIQIARQYEMQVKMMKTADENASRSISLLRLN